jgi:hypothetical protein
VQSAAVRKVAAYTMSTAPVTDSKASSDNCLYRSRLVLRGCPSFPHNAHARTCIPYVT